MCKQKTSTDTTGMEAATPESCKERVFAHWDLLDRLARKRFQDQNLAEEALLHVQERLAADSWKRVRAFAGRSSFARFLSHVAMRLMEDFARSKFGRLRPPSWVRQLSGIWLDAFRLLCVERMRSVDAVEYLVDSAPAGRDPDQVEDVVSQILGRIPGCGERRGLEVGMEEEVMDAVIHVEPSEGFRPPERELLSDEREDALAACRIILCCDAAALPDADDRFGGLASCLRQELELGDEERLLLSMVFEQGMNVSAAGRVLGLRADQAHGRMRSAVKRIRDLLDKGGWSEMLKELVLES